MTTIKFNPKGVAATLTNRVYRTGISMMSTVDRVQNKGESLAAGLVEDLETDYLLSCIELESAITSNIANKDKIVWDDFRATYEELKDIEKPLYRGVIRGVKKTASDILSGLPDPFAPWGAPPHIMPYVPTHPDLDKELWKEIFGEIEMMEATHKGLVSGVGKVAGAVATAGAATAAVAAGTVAAGSAAVVAVGVAAGAAAFEGGVEIGNAINDYMGWEKWE